MYQVNMIVAQEPSLQKSTQNQQPYMKQNRALITRAHGQAPQSAERI
jgi:hypothetical protein